MRAAATLVADASVVVVAAAVALALVAEEAAAHGSMNGPLPRGAKGVPFSGSDPAWCFEVWPGSCLWYSVGCVPGCERCEGAGKVLYLDPARDVPSCNASSITEPTLPEYARSWNVGNVSQRGDWTRFSPWRSPGAAPVADPCGMASGYYFDGLPPGAYPYDLPLGHAYGDRGSALPQVGDAARWSAGDTVELSYGIWANHGGGIQYRLCPKTAGAAPTEACFRSMPLAFATGHSTIRYADGAREDILIDAVDVSEGVTPANSTWRRMPIPACNCDAGGFCASGGEILSSGKTDTDYVAYEDDGDAMLLERGECPTGTQFPPPAPGVLGRGGYTCTKGMTGWTPPPGSCDGNFEFSIVDEVYVPEVPGEYFLQWRMDAEQTAQVWNSCADVVIE